MLQSPPVQRSDRASIAPSPERWQRAAERAIAERIEVRQVNASGMWVASSGSHANAAYEVEVTGNVAHGCTCLAGLNADPVCKHRAAFYLLIGALDPTPEPDPPARGAGGDCPECRGCGVLYCRELERRGLLYPPCAACAGSGIAPEPRVAA